MLEVETLTKETVEAQITKMGNRLLNPGTPTSWIWMLIEIQWVSMPRKSGGTLKRGSQYGVVKYFDMTQQKHSSFSYVELTKDEAITEAMKPISLRSALQEINEAKECYVCGKIGIGKRGYTRDTWGHFSYQPRDTLYRKWLDICEDCTAFIVSRHLENFIK